MKRQRGSGQGQLHYACDLDIDRLRELGLARSGPSAIASRIADLVRRDMEWNFQVPFVLTAYEAAANRGRCR